MTTKLISSRSPLRITQPGIPSVRCQFCSDDATEVLKIIVPSCGLRIQLALCPYHANLPVGEHLDTLGIRRL